MQSEPTAELTSEGPSSEIRVAVCLAVFNGIRWLPDQVASILAQRNVNLTLFVSVDVSSDGSEQWVDQLAAQDSRLAVLPHGHRFGHAAQNFFRLLNDIDFTPFDYVSLADQDDIWFPDKLWRAHECLVRSGADAYSANVLAFWPDGREVLINKAQPQQRWDYFFEAAGPGCTYVIKKKVVESVQRLLVQRAEESGRVGLHDWFLYAYVRAKGGRWFIDPQPCMRYRQHAQNQVGVNKGMRALWQRVRQVGSGWAMAQAALIVSLVDATEDPFVKRWITKRNRVWLAFQARQCRRRGRDQVFFFFSCLLLMFTKR